MITHEKRLEYPHPQFVRDEWIDLCGEWEFEFDRNDIGIKNQWFNYYDFSSSIIVPFCYQSKLSGIDTTEDVNVVWYKKTVTLKNDERVRQLLHFEAVDYETMVWANGQFIGIHKGGFTPFVFDITDSLQSDSNVIVVRVHDDTSPCHPLGKQSWKDENFLCWYTRTTGIWQPVWIENVPKNYISKILMTPNLDTSSLGIEILMNSTHCEGQVEAKVYFRNRIINSAQMRVCNGSCSTVLDVSSDASSFRVEQWEPNMPNLYDIQFVYTDGCGNTDKIISYFGMRKTEAKNGKILLNNKDFYQKLVLNQGYYKDGLMTPPSVESFVDDIMGIKECGFNGLRIHQKVEDSRFLYLCDYYGLVVWSEIPSCYKFDSNSKKSFWNEMQNSLIKHYNHPSVIVWVLFNESWGINEIYANTSQQHFVNAAYEYIKSIDSTRLVIGNDGWEHVKTDILTIHDYTSEASQLQQRYVDLSKNINGSFSTTSTRSNFANGYVYNNQPIMISEFGGIAFGSAIIDHSWGYGKRIDTKEEFLERFKELTTAIMDLESICGFCYTQWSDVEQEINGIVDADHEMKFSYREFYNILSKKRNYGYIFE
ncbi:sugar-binding domain-containing protein [Oscillospiraceae bacterium PP1C4]